ncbi:uncharacterized protein [Diadema antillarum]|uniref:uncharacterized protein n=1 Tax=Diadema antillarum TaxID=105358 RepID=UPI003A8AD1E2
MQMSHSQRKCKDLPAENHGIGGKQSNVPHFDVLSESTVDGATLCSVSEKGPKQTNAAMCLAGEGTLSQSRFKFFEHNASHSKQTEGQHSRVTDSLVFERRINGVSTEDIKDNAFQTGGKMFRRKAKERHQSSSNTSHSHLPPSVHPSSQHGTTHLDISQRLSSNGSFHLSHLEGYEESEEVDEMDFPSPSGSFSSVHTLTEVYIKHLPSMSSDDVLRRSNLSLHGHPNHHSSEHDALSWEQHKMLAGRRRERQSIHEEERENSEIMEQRTFNSPEETTSVLLDFGEETAHSGQEDQRMPEARTNNQRNKFQSPHRHFGWTADVDSELTMKATAAHYYDNGAHFPENEFRHENIHKNSRGISYMYDSPGDEQGRSSSQTALPGSGQSHSISQQYYQSHPLLSDKYAFPKELSNPSTLHVDVGSYDKQSFPLRQVTNSVTSSFKQPTNDLRNLGAGTEVLDKASSMDTFSRRSTSHKRLPRRRNLEQDFEISASGWHVEQNQDYHSSTASSQNVDESNTVVEERLSRQKHLQEYGDLVERSGHNSGRRTEKASKPQTLLDTSATDFQVLDRHTRHKDEGETQKQYHWHRERLHGHDKVLSQYLHSPGLGKDHDSSDGSELLSSRARVSMPSHLHSTGLSSGSRIPVSQAALNPSTDDVHDLLLSSVPSGFKVTDHSTTKSHPEPRDGKHSTMPLGGGSLRTQLDTIPSTTSRNHVLTQRLETTQRLSRTLTVSGQHDGELLHSKSSSKSASDDQHKEFTLASSKRSVATDVHSRADPSVIHTRLSAEESIQLRHSSGKQYESPVSQEVRPNDQHRSSKLDDSGSYLEFSHYGKSLELPVRRGHQSNLTSPTKRSQLQINSHQWRVPEEMHRDQSWSHYHDDDLLLSDLSTPAMGNPHPLSQLNDTVPGSSMRKHGGTLKLSASAGTRRTTSVLWVSKLVDLLRNEPAKKHEILVAKAYWFKKWQRCVRLLKLKHQEEQDQLRKAITFHQISLQQKILRDWHCEVQSKYHAARLLHQRHLLLKGFNAFRFAVMSIRVQREQLERRLRHDKLAKCFNKWKALVCWRSERESLLEQLAMQHVTVKAFRVWREGYHMQQRIGIADLHYKVCLLSTCLDYWRRYVAGRRKKFCRTEMARVFHEDGIVKRAWVTMVTVATERQRARRLYRRFTLTRAWTAWKHGSQIAKMENLHGNSQVVVFRQQAVLRRHFAEWRERARLSLMRGQIEKRQVCQAFQLWKLKVRRRQLVYRILESRSRKAMKKSALVCWRKYTRDVKERRQEAVRLVVRVQLGVVMTTWRNWACRQIQLRTNLHQCLAARAVETEHAAFLRWRSLVRERQAGREARERWSRGCVSRAAVRWRLVVKEARQEVEVKVFLRGAEKSLVKSAFYLWHGALLRAEEDRRRVEEARLRLAESRLHRSLLAWKLEMLEARAVRPLTERRKKRNLARVFDAWRDVAERTKAGLEFATLRQVRCLSRSFSFWRVQTVSMQNWRREQEEVDADLVRSCFQAWSRLHQRAVAGKTVARQRNVDCLRDAFLSWKAMVEEAEIERDNQAGNEGRRQVLQRVFFRAWQRARGEKEAMEDEKCRAVQDRQLTVTLTKAWTQWKKSLQLEITARAVEARVKHRLLHQAFWAWHSYVQTTVEGAVHEFSRMLDSPASTSPQGWKISGAGTTMSYAASSFSSSSSSHRLDNQSPPLPGATPSPLREVSSYHTPHSPESQESLSFEESDDDSVSPKSSQDYVTAATSLSQIQSPQESSGANTPSPLQSLSLHFPEIAGPTFLEKVGVGSQSQSVDGSVVSVEEGHSSSARSGESQPSCLGRSSIADSGYSGNGLFHHLGDRHLEVSSESASIKSVKSSSSVAVETHSPHSNNSNNVAQSNASFWQNRFKEDNLQGHLCFDEGRYSNLRDIGPRGFRNGYHAATSPSGFGTYVLTDDLLSLTKRTYTEKKQVQVERSLYYSHNEAYDHRVMAYLTSVILRLRLWPASAAFYQWLEAVRKRKAQRHCCRLVQRGVASRLLRDSFMLWLQVAWKNQMASNHCDKVLLRKCIHRWSTIKHLQAEREVQELGASERATVSRLKYAWNTWKERYLRSQYAAGHVPSWDAHIGQSRVVSQKCAVHQTKIQGRNLRECLVFWKLRWWQLKQADLFQEKVIVQRCLNAWLAWHREKRWQEEAARSLLEKRRKKLAFHHWRAQLLRREQVHSHYHSAAHSHLCLIVRVWYQWAAANRKLRLLQEMVGHQRSVALVRQGWATEGLGMDNVWATHSTKPEEVDDVMKETNHQQIMINGQFWKSFGEWIEVLEEDDYTHRVLVHYARWGDQWLEKTDLITKEDFSSSCGTASDVKTALRLAKKEKLTISINQNPECAARVPVDPLVFEESIGGDIYGWDFRNVPPGKILAKMQQRKNYPVFFKRKNYSMGGNPGDDPSSTAGLMGPRSFTVSDSRSLTTLRGILSIGPANGAALPDTPTPLGNWMRSDIPQTQIKSCTVSDSRSLTTLRGILSIGPANGAALPDTPPPLGNWIRSDIPQTQIKSCTVSDSRSLTTLRGILSIGPANGAALPDTPPPLGNWIRSDIPQTQIKSFTVSDSRSLTTLRGILSIGPANGAALPDTPTPLGNWMRSDIPQTQIKSCTVSDSRSLTTLRGILSIGPANGAALPDTPPPLGNWIRFDIPQTQIKCLFTFADYLLPVLPRVLMKESCTRLELVTGVDQWQKIASAIKMEGKKASLERKEKRSKEQLSDGDLAELEDALDSYWKSTLAEMIDKKTFSRSDALALRGYFIVIMAMDNANRSI